jgi:gliding motility-associated-like protein
MVWKRLLIVLVHIFISAIAFGQSITVQNFTSSSYAAGGSITVPIKVDGCFALTNRFELYLSDASGNFAGNGTLIGGFNSFFAPFVNGVIPASAPAGSNYKMRIVSTQPVVSVETGTFSITSTVASPVANLLTSASNTLNDSTYGRCLVFGPTNITLQATVPAGYTMSAQLSDSVGGNVAVTLFPTQIQFVMMPNNWYTLKVQLKNTADNSISTKTFLVIVSANNLSLQTSGASDACLPDTKVYTVNVTGNGGIRFNYPGTKYMIDWGDGTLDTYTQCALIKSGGEMKHDYVNTSCGRPPITDLNPVQYNAFRVNVQASNVYCPNSFTSITTYAKVWQKPIARFINPLFGCINTPITFPNTSEAGLSGYNNVVNCIDVAQYEWYVDGQLIFGAGKDLVYTFTTPGYHTIRLVALNDPCSDEFEEEICIEEEINPSFKVNGMDSISGCAPLNLTINNQTPFPSNPCRPLKWHWEVFLRPAMTLATYGVHYTISPNDSANNPTFQFLIPGEYYIRLSTSNSCGVKYKDVPVTITDVANVTFQNSAVSYCGIKTIDFSLPPHRPTYSSTTGFETYQWTIAGGSFSFLAGTTATSAYPKIQFNNLGTYTIQLQFVNACGVRNASQTITFEAPVSTTATNDTTICFNVNTLQLNASSTGPVGSGVWTIINGSGSFSNPAIPNAVYTFSTADKAAGSVQLQYTVTGSSSACGPARDTVTITIRPENKITTTADTTICSGKPLNYTPVTGINGTTFTWTSTITSGTVTGNTPSGSGPINDVLINSSFGNNAVVKYTITPVGNGCTGTTFTLTVTVVPSPDLSLSVSNDTLCTGETLDIGMSSSYTGALYTWTTNVSAGAVSGATDQTTPSSQNPITHTLINTGTIPAVITYTIKVYANGTSCEGATKTVTIVVEPEVTNANAGADQLLCNQPSTTLAGNQPAIGTGKWTLVAGPAVTITNANNYNTTVTGLQPNAVYTFVWTIKGASSCPVSTDTVIITNRPAITPANAGADKLFCDFDGVTGSVVLSANAPAFAVQLGTWTLIQPIPVNSNPVIADLNYPGSTFSFDKKGTYTLVWTITGDGDCTPNTDTVLVRVFDAPYAGAITPAVSTICIGENVSLTVGPIVGNIIKWQYNKAPFSDNVWKDTLVTSASISFNNIQDSILIRAIVQSDGFSFGCTSTDTSELGLINVTPKSVGGNTNADATLCYNSNAGTITLTNNVGDVLRWETSNNYGITWVPVINTSKSVDYTNLTSTTWYRAIVQSGTCAPAISDTTIITVVPLVTQAYAGIDQLICTATTSLQANTVATGETGLWSQIGGPNTATLSSTSTTNITASGLVAGPYQFVWTIANNTCPATADTVEVVVRPAITPANAGADVVVCDFVSSATVTLAGNIDASRPYEAGVWSIISQPAAGNGVISTVSDPAATFTFNAPGTYQLQWLITNDAGCAPTKDTVTIYAFDKPVVGTISGTPELCAGGNVQVNLSSFTGVIKKWQYNPSPVNDNQWIDTAVTTSSINFLSVNDTFAVRVIVVSDGLAYGCTSADTSNFLVINVVPVTVPGTTSANATVCTNNNTGIITLSGNVGIVVRWEFSTDNGNNWTPIVNQTSTHTYNNLAITTWFRAIVASGNCGTLPSTATIITVVPEVTLALVGNDQLICDTVATLQSNAPGIGETGAWIQVSGPNTAVLSSTTSTSITASGLVAGTYQFAWSISNSICPSSADTVQVVVRAAVTTANAGTDKIVCDLVNTATVTLAANINSSRPFEAGTWTIISQPVNGNGSFSNATDPNAIFTLSAAGTYALEWMITNDAGCTPTKDTVIVTAFDKPDAGDITGITNLCAGGNVPVTLNSFTGVIRKWQYNPKPINDNIWIDTAVTSSTINFLGVSDTFAVRVIVQSSGFASGCTSTDTSNVLVVNVTPNTSPGTTAPNAIVCANANAGTITLTGNVGAIVRWEYSTTNGSTWVPINNISATYNYSNLTTTTFFRAIVESGNCGNIASSITIITVVPQVSAANAGADITTCNNNVMLAANTPAANETGSWTQLSGPTTATLSSVSSPSINVTNLVSGSYQFVWKIDNGGCAPTTDTVLVNVRPAITVANAGSDTVLCSFSGSANVTLNGSFNPSRTYEVKQWSIISQPAAGNGTFSDASDPSAIFSFNAPGTYTLAYAITNDGGCSPTKDTIVIYAFEKPVAGPLSGPSNICAGNDAVVTLNSFTGVIQKWQYNPAPIADNIWIDTTVTSATISFINVRDTIAIRAIVQSAGFAMGCTGADTSNILVIQVTPAAIAGITAANDTVCNGMNGGAITLTGNVGAVVRWESSTDNGNNWSAINNTNNLIQYSNLTATTWFRAIIQSGSCGTVPSSITIITVIDSITAPTAGADQVLCNATQAVLSGNSVLFGETGTWSQLGGPAVSFSSTSIPTITVSNLQPGTYTFLYTIANGICPSRTDTIVVLNHPPIVNIIDTTAKTICFGGVLSVAGQLPTGGNGTYTFQWQQSTNGTNWVNISGQVNQSLSIIPAASVYVRRLVTSLPCTSISAVAFVTVQPPVSNNTITANQNICTNTLPAQLTGSLPTGATGVYNYQWQESTDGGSTWLNIAGANGQHYQPIALTVSTLFRRNVSSGYCTASQGTTSDSVLIKVNPNAQALFTYVKDTSCPVFVLDSANIVNQHFAAGNGGYLWYANNNLLGTTEAFPGYSIQNSGDSVIIKLIALSSFGCKNDTMQHTFYAKLKPSPAFTVSDSVGCGPLTVTFTNTTPNPLVFQYKWNFGNGQTLNAFNPGSVVFMPNPTGADTTYKVSLTVYSECDSITVFQNIRVKAKPRALFSPDKTSGCSPLTVTFRNTSYGSTDFTWDFGDGSALLNTPSTNDVKHTFVTTVRDTFQVRLIARNSCGIDTQRFSIIVAPNNIGLYITVNGTDAAGCSPHAVTFYNNSVGASSYIWNFGDGNTQTTYRSTDTLVHVFNQPGVYTVQVKASNGCADTVTYKTITVHGVPKVDFTATPNVVCVGEVVRFNNLSDTITNSSWSFGDATTSSLTNPTHAYTAAGTYTITLVGSRQYNSGNICLDSANKTVQVIASRPGAFGVSDSISRCVPFTVKFTNQSLPSSLTVWDFGNGARDTGNVVSHTFTTTGNFNVVMNAQSPGGCKYQANRNIIVNGPQGTMTYDTGVICGLAPVRFETNTTGVDSVKWTFGDGSSLTTTAPIIYHTYLQAGNYVPSVMFMANNATCRSILPGADTIKIEKIKAGFTTAMIKECGQTKVVFTDTTKAYFGVRKWSWNFGDGGSATVQHPTHMYTTANNWPVTLIAKSAVGCADTANLVLNVPVANIPKAFITADTIACVNQGVNYTSSVISQDSISLYLWSFSNGASANLANSSTSYGTAGNHLATLVISTVNGCRDTATRKIYINPTPLVKATDDVTLCKGQVVQLNVSGASTYSWTPSTTLSCATCTNPIATPVTTTVYTVTGTNLLGCYARDTVRVNIAQPFKMKISTNDTICAGERIQLFASGAEMYKWAPSTTLDNSTIPDPVAAPLATTVYRVVGADSANCFTDTAYTRITVGKNPTVDLGADKVVAAGTFVELKSVVTNGPIVNWEWKAGPDITCINCPLPTAQIKRDITYTVKVTNTFECIASDTIRFKVFCEQSQVFIPNVFTPDGDGFNDVLMVRGQGIRTVKLFRIFNRWGEIVFEKANFAPNEKANGWDGTVRGVKAPPDVYVYMCEVTCENDVPFTYKGNVAIIK